MLGKRCLPNLSSCPLWGLVVSFDDRSGRPRDISIYLDLPTCLPLVLSLVLPSAPHNSDIFPGLVKVRGLLAFSSVVLGFNPLMSQEKETNFRSVKSDVEAGRVVAGTVTNQSPIFLDKYPGSGTADDPYVVDWGKGDEENPYNWSTRRKWMITLQVCAPRQTIRIYLRCNLSHCSIQLAFSTFTVSFCSSSYTGGLASITKDLHVSEEVAILGVSLYVLGFGLG